jgi:hypothetical protein
MQVGSSRHLNSTIIVIWILLTFNFFNARSNCVHVQPQNLILFLVDNGMTINYSEFIIN